VPEVPSAGGRRANRRRRAGVPVQCVRAPVVAVRSIAAAG